MNTYLGWCDTNQSIQICKVSGQILHALLLPFFQPRAASDNELSVIVTTSSPHGRNGHDSFYHSIGKIWVQGSLRLWRKIEWKQRMKSRLLLVGHSLCPISRRRDFILCCTGIGPSGFKISAVAPVPVLSFSVRSCRNHLGSFRVLLNSFCLVQFR